MKQTLSFYKALSEDTRLKTLLLLCKHGSLCVCDLTDVLDLSQPKVSRHLAELRNLGLVDAQRRGKWVHYCLAEDLLQWQLQVLAATAANNNELLASLEAKLAPLETRQERC